METDWAENRAKLPQDIIRGTLGKLVDSVYSTGELDRFRTRLERTPNGTEIFVSHRGMEEVYNTARKDQTVWQPRATDPELEAEFLRRLMVKLGVSQEQSKAARRDERAGAHRARSPMSTASPWCRSARTSTAHGAASASRWTAPASPSKTATAAPAPTSCATWRPTPTRRNPASSASCSPSAARARPKPPLKYRIMVKGQGEASTVSVLNESGAPETSANAQRIVQVIADDLK